MSSTSPVSAREDQALMTEFWSDDMRYFPEHAVMFGFPWGKVGTPLEGITQPREWQMRELRRYGEHIRRNAAHLHRGEELETYQFACCSGRGIGKSALFGMISWFHMTCWPGSTTIASANGEPQLDSKTFPEIRKWFTLAINAHWFDCAARSVRPTQWYKELLEKQLKVDCGYFYVMGQLWTEEKPDAFAGAHNPLGLIVLFDEASGIPQSIWVVTKGFFTEKCVSRAWFTFSNGRKNSGPFFECFHKMREYWNPIQIDSRDVEGVDKADLTQIITEYGEDSDEARIEVRGMFPAKGDKQLIDNDTIQAAATRETPPLDDHAPLTMAIDVARFGEDTSVISFKQGRDARSIPWEYFKKISTTALAAKAASFIEKYNPDAIFVDGNGVGGGVVDTLEDMGYDIIEVQNGESPDDAKQYSNKRTECWCKMGDWLTVGAIPDESRLKTDLGAPEFGYVGKDQQKALEPKEKTKKRGFASPDWADSLAMHFAKNISRRDSRSRGRRKNRRVAEGVDYDVLS